MRCREREINSCKSVSPRFDTLFHLNVVLEAEFS